MITQHRMVSTSKLLVYANDAYMYSANFIVNWKRDGDHVRSEVHETESAMFRLISACVGIRIETRRYWKKICELMQLFRIHMYSAFSRYICQNDHQGLLRNM